MPLDPFLVIRELPTQERKESAKTLFCIFRNPYALRTISLDLSLVASILALLSFSRIVFQNVVLMAPDLFIQVVECRYFAVALPPEPVFSDSASTCVTLVDFKSRRKDSFKHYCPLQLQIICLNHIKADLFVLRQGIWHFARKID